MLSTSVSTQDQAKMEEQKLSPAELKKKAKADKQARRVAQKEQNPDEVAAPGSSVSNHGVNGDTEIPDPPGTASQEHRKSKTEKASNGQPQKHGKQSSQDGKSQHKRTPTQQQQITPRRRPSQSGGQKPAPAPKKGKKQVELFNHLYSQPRRHNIEGVPKDTHPAILALGFQLSSYEICGSNARCVAMLLAFKEAIQEYTTPAGTSMARHLTSHYLSPQIDFLKSCRPISESMGNAIRWLKNLIANIDPSTADQEAKDDLCERIVTFIHERITVTDQAIAASACFQIRDGSVVLTFAKSSIVEKTILEAHANETKFRVIVVDSRPLFEGKRLATSLVNAGLEVEYLPFSAISHAVKQATVVLLGAHSMLSNGRLQSRIGTASVAMQSAKRDIPVIVCCESVKFSGKLALDSIVYNEVAPTEELLLAPQHSAAEATAKKWDHGEEYETKIKALSDWEDIMNLQLLNLMYDVTPAEYIRMVICEYGSLPPSSIPVVHRLANDAM